MRRTYTLKKSGQKIHCWYSDMGRLTIYTDEKGTKEKCTLEFDDRSEDPTIVYKGETIHLNDFDYTPLNELLAKVEAGIQNKDRWAVFEEEGLATIMKERDNVGFVMEVDCFDTIIPGLGIGMKSNDGPKVEALMVPFTDQWDVKDWHYKIELHTEDEQLRPMVGRETMYFTDLWSTIMAGSWIRIVNRHEYRKEHPTDIMTRNGRVTCLNII